MFLLTLHLGTPCVLTSGAALRHRWWDVRGEAGRAGWSDRWDVRGEAGRVVRSVGRER